MTRKGARGRIPATEAERPLSVRSSEIVRALPHGHVLAALGHRAPHRTRRRAAAPRAATPGAIWCWP